MRYTFNSNILCLSILVTVLFGLSCWKLGYLSPVQIRRRIRGRRRQQMTLHNIDEDLLRVDETVLENVRANLESARAIIQWMNPGSIPEKMRYVTAQPLMATVDRRPLTRRKQIRSLNSSGSVSSTQIGCAFSTNTAVSDIGRLDIVKSSERKHNKEYCALCFQFASLLFAEQFLPNISSPYDHNGIVDESIRCIRGDALIHSRFASFQWSYRHPSGVFPWTIDCTLPNTYLELDCEQISHYAENQNDELQSIFLQTKFSLFAQTEGFFGQLRDMEFQVISRWPWDALKAHSYTKLPSVLDDNSTRFVPSKSEELKLAYFQGPVYTLEGQHKMKNKDKANFRLDSPNLNPLSKGGLHRNFVNTAIQLARLAVGANIFVGVPDGQVQRTYESFKDLLATPLIKLFPKKKSTTLLEHHHVILGEGKIKGKMTDEYITFATLFNSHFFSDASYHLSHLLSARSISITLVPLPTPALSFKTLLIGGQYAFTSYIVARYSADFHAMMYFDGDAVPLDNPKVAKSLKEAIYYLFFTNREWSAPGRRFALVEYSVKNRFKRPTGYQQCFQQYFEDAMETQSDWSEKIDKCGKAMGNVVARCDSIEALDIHYASTDPELLPSEIGIEDTEIVPDDYFIELHMTTKSRRQECLCRR